MKTFIQILIVLVIIITCKSTDPQFNFRNLHFNFGQNILKIKYSYDNQLLMVIRNTTEIISMYDGINFNFLNNFTLQSNNIMLPIDFQFVDDYLIVIAVQKQTISNLIFIYRRYNNTKNINFLTTFSTYTHFQSQLKGLRFEKVNADYVTEVKEVNEQIEQNVANEQIKHNGIERSIQQKRVKQQNSIKRLVIWGSTQLQVYEYRPKQSPYILKYLSSDRIRIQNSTFRFVQFYDQNYLLLSHEWIQEGQNQGRLIVTNFQNKYYQVFPYLAYSGLQIKARTDQKFLILTTNDSVMQMVNNRDSQIVSYDKTIDSFYPNLFYDDARLFGYFNSNNLKIYRVDNPAGSVPNPNYTQKLSMYTTEGIKIAVISPNSGQLLISNNRDGYLFSFLSICPEGSYYNNTIASQQCVNCSLNLCSKCINGICTACPRYYYLTNEGCISCQIVTPYCRDCSSGVCTQCHTDSHRFPDPQTKKCICLSPYTQNPNNNCVICNQSNCLYCLDDNKCSKCDTKNGWVEDGYKCICDKGLYQDVDKCLRCNQKFYNCNQCQNSTTACTSCAQGYTIEAGYCKESSTNDLWFIFGLAASLVIMLVIIWIVFKMDQKKKRSKSNLQQPINQAVPAPYFVLNQQEKRVLPSLIQSDNNIPIPQQVVKNSFSQSFKSNDQFQYEQYLQKQDKIRQQNEYDKLDDVMKIIRINKMKQQVKMKKDKRKRNNN